METSGWKPQEESAVPMNPSSSQQQGRHRKNSVMHTRSNPYSHAMNNFFMLQNSHILRLQHLFPEINQAKLSEILDKCQGDFITTVDVLLNIRRNSSTQREHVVVPVYKESSAAAFKNNTAKSYPTTHSLDPRRSTNMATTEAPISVCTVETAVRMPPAAHATQSNYYANWYPVMNSTNSTNGSNNTVFMPTSVVVQRPNQSASVTNIQHANAFSDTRPVSCPTSPEKKNPALIPILPTQRNNTSLKSMFHLPPPQCDVQQLNSDTTTGVKSDFYGQYVEKPSQMIKPNLVFTATQEINHSLTAESNTVKQPRLTTNQVPYKVMPQVFTQQQQNSCLQQQYVQQQAQEECKKNPPLEVVITVHPQNTQQFQQGLEQVYVLPDSNIASTNDHNPEHTNSVQNICKIQDVWSIPKKNMNRKLHCHSQLDDGFFTKADAGKYEDAKTLMHNDGMPPSLKTNARPVTGEAQASNTTFSDADLNKLTVGSSYLLTEKLFDAEDNEWNNLDDTPSSGDSCLVIDTDAEENNIGSECDHVQCTK